MTQQLRIDLEGVNYQGEGLDEDENLAFNLAFDRYLAPLFDQIDLTFAEVTAGAMDGTTDLNTNSVTRQAQLERRVKIPQDVLAQTYQARREVVRAAIAVAKSQLNGAFRGLYGSQNELIIGEMNAWHILRKANATELPAEAWDMWSGTAASGTYTAQGAAWAQGADNWIGYGSTNANAIHVDKNVLLVILGYTDLAAVSPVQSVRLQVGNITYTPTILKTRIGLSPANYRTPIVGAKTQLLPPRTTCLGTIYTDRAIASELVVIGFSIGTADYMNNHYLATVST